MNDLQTQLERAAAYDAEFGHNLATHLPMALTALHRLGADSAAREAFIERYLSAHRLHAAPPIEVWPAGDAWRDRLGDPAAWPAYRGLFHAWIEHEGVHEVLAQVLPWLMPGVGAVAFHGMLRVAYGISAEHAGEVADGLAYWTCRWFDCGAAQVDQSASDPAELLAALHIQTAPRGLIAERMDLVARTPAFAAAMKRLKVNAKDTLPVLARLAAEHYAASGSFTLLHVLTSAQAMHTLLPLLEERDRDQAVACYAAAGAAAWISAIQRVLPSPPSLTWSEVIARALDASTRPDEAHVIKCVDAAHEMDRIDPHPRWLAAAARAVV